mgnify:CR=1 FL=1
MAEAPGYTARTPDSRPSECLRSEETAQWGSGTYMCVEDCDVLQVTEVRPQWFGGERSRRAESTSPTSATVSVGGTGPDRDVQALLWLAAQGL